VRVILAAHERYWWLHSFKARLLPDVGPATLRRFIKHTEDYVNGFGVEAELREKNVVLDIPAYNKLRRENSAVRYCFGLFGYLLDDDLPDEIFEHPVFMRMHLAAVDMIAWANVCSFFGGLNQVLIFFLPTGCLLLQHGASYGAFHK
jgi:hypothetical protein